MLDVKHVLSIIIPLYNAENFVGRAIESCLSQGYFDFELILVNDGSKDDSLKLIRTYAETDKRIRVLDKANEGVVIAREFGLAHSTGEFILFMDADDTLVIDSLQKLVEAIDEETDMVIADINQVEVDGSCNLISYGYKDNVSGKEHFNWIVDKRVGFLWGKLIRRTLFETIAIKPYGLKFCEDYVQMLQLSYYSRKVKHIGTVSYNYVQQPESACNKALSIEEYAQRFADLCKKIAEIIERLVVDKETSIRLKVLFLYYCRLFLCSNGSWNQNNDLKPMFQSFISDKYVSLFYLKNDKRRYYMTLLTSYLYPLISIAYKKKIRKNGRIS